MSLFALGLNHQTAPVAIRERVAFATEALAGAVGDFTRGRAVKEAAIISTCNRTELYVSGEQPALAADWLAEYHRLPPAELSPYLYTLPREQAVRHAFRVAAGLDSMVLGEPQILGQMKDAVRAAETAGTLGATLHKLFQRSFAVAKEVRTTTQVGANSVSMAAAAVKLAARIFPSISGQKVLFIGAGEMIELCATHFAAQNPARLTVANRTFERAAALAHRFNGRGIELRELSAQLHEYDIVVSCTASSLPILGKGLVERALKARRRRPMFMVDLAVPRDIEAEVGDLDDIFLYTVDDLAGIVAANMDLRRSAVEQAEAIIETQVGQFMHWMQARESVPLIRSLREKAEEAREAEVERAMRMLARGEDPKAVLDALSRGLTNKLMHAPTQALNEAQGEERRALAGMLARLFHIKH